MKRNIRLTTGILSLVLLGSIGVSFVSQEATSLVNQVNAYSDDARYSDSELDARYTLEASDDTFSEENQAIIAEDIDAKKAVSETTGNTYNFAFSTYIKTSPDNATAFGGYTYSEATSEVTSPDYSIGEITLEDLMTTMGLTVDSTLPEVLIAVRDFYSNKDQWYLNDWYTYETEGEYDYTLNLNVDALSHSSSTDYQHDYSYWYSHSTTDETSIVDSDYNKSAMDNVWLGEYLTDTATYDGALTSYEAYDGTEFTSTPADDVFQPYASQDGIELGYAKLNQTDVNGQTKEVYSRISIMPESTNSELDPGNLNEIVRDNSSYTGDLQITLEDLPTGYTYEIEDIYLAYLNQNYAISGGGDSAQGEYDHLNKLDGSDNYNYITMKDRNQSYTPEGESSTFFAWEEGVTSSEIQNEIQSDIEKKVNWLVYPALMNKIEESWLALQEQADWFIQETKTLTQELIASAPKLPTLAKADNFTVVDEERDYVVFQADVIEGTTSEDWDTMYTDGVDYGFDLENYNIVAEVTIPTEMGTRATETVALDFDEIDNVAIGGEDGTTEYTHTFKVSGYYTWDGMTAGTTLNPLVPGTTIESLQFVFASDNPYVITPAPTIPDDITLAWVIPNLTEENALTIAQFFASNYIHNQYEEESSVSGYNTITSNDGESLMVVKDYNKPIVKSTLKWYDVSPTSAKMQFTYLTDEVDGASGFYSIDPEKGVSLFWDKNNDGIYDGTRNEKYDVGTENFKFLGTEVDDKYPGIYTATYEITGLQSHTTYDNFALYVDSPEILEGYTFVMPSATVEWDEDRLVEFPEGSNLVTPHEMEFYFKIALWLLIILIVIILIYIVVWGIVWWHRHMSLAVCYDGPASFEQGELIINLFHANRYSRIWNAHEEDLVLMAAGKQIDASFRKSDSLKNGLKIYVTEDTTEKRSVLSIMSASKYNQYYIGIRGDHHTYHAQVISDEKAKKIAKMVHVDAIDAYDETKEMILSDLVKKSSKDYAKLITNDKKSENEIIAHISDRKSKYNSIRYQCLFPVGFPMVEEFDPERDDAKVVFYHVYNGGLYKLDHKFVSKHGSLFEYDLVNLEPGTIYVGLSVSLDGGKTIIPSASLYGITRSAEKGVFPSKTDAKLGKPKTASTKPAAPMWTLEHGRKFLDESQLHRTIDIIVKKHYEDANPNEWVSSDEAEQFWPGFIDVWEAKNSKANDARKQEAATTIETALLSVKTTTKKKSTSAKSEKPKSSTASKAKSK